MKILLGVLICLIFNLPLSAADIEIYSAGKYFKSFKEYKENKPSIFYENFKITGPVVESRSAPYISKQDIRRWGIIGYDHEINKKILDFKANSQEEDLPLISDSHDLQEAISQTLSRSKQPTLIISDSGRVRILTLTDKSVKQ